MSQLTITDSKTVALQFDDEKVQLLRDTICKGCTPNEMELFLHICKRTGLDPFVRQIYPVKRWDSNLKREAMVTQTGIDGYRLIADRTGRYAPSKDAFYQYKPDGSLLSATAYVKKQTMDGTWHEVSATAFFDEYCQKTKDGKLTNMWATKGHIMIAKCAESLAIRKCFPAELSGVYTDDEMSQADSESKAQPQVDMTPVSEEQATMLDSMIGNDKEFRDQIMKGLEKLNIRTIKDIPMHLYPRIYNAAKNNMQKNLSQISEVVVVEETEE